MRITRLFFSILLLCPTAWLFCPTAKADGATECDSEDLKPVEFANGSYSKAMALFLGTSSPVNPSFVPVKFVFSFSDCHPEVGYSRPVRDLFVDAEFDAKGTFDSYYGQIMSQVPSEDCSYQHVHSINWDIVEPTGRSLQSATHGAFLGHFHVKHVTRACIYGAITDLGTTEADFYNKVGMTLSKDKTRIDPIKENWATDNVSPFARAISNQFIGALVQILSLGLIPQGNVQSIDAVQAETDALTLINEIENGFVNPVVAPGPQKVGGDDVPFALDFLYEDVKFGRLGDHPGFFLRAKQNTKTYAINDSLAHNIHKRLTVIQTEGQNIDANGTQYQVKSGDSLWKLATHFYGDGDLHLLIAASNNIPDKNLNKLQVGKTIVIQPIGLFRTNKQLLFVSKGDSFWKIAKQRQGGRQSFQALEKANVRMVSDADHIYPIEVLRSASSPTK